LANAAAEHLQPVALVPGGMFEQDGMRRPWGNLAGCTHTAYDQRIQIEDVESKEPHSSILNSKSEIRNDVFRGPGDPYERRRRLGK
jgi:hypothetical protein